MLDPTHRLRERIADLDPRDVHETARTLGLWAFRARGKGRPRRSLVERATPLVELFPDPTALRAAYAPGAKVPVVDDDGRAEFDRTAWLVVARLDPDLARACVREVQRTGGDCAPIAGEALAVCGTEDDVANLLAWVRASAPADPAQRPNLHVSARTVAYLGGPAPGLHRAARVAGTRLLAELARVVGSEPFVDGGHAESSYAQWLACALAGVGHPEAQPLLAALEARHPDGPLRLGLATARRAAEPR